MTTPAGKFFYHNSFFRGEKYFLKGKGHDDDGVDSDERTIITAKKMDKNKKKVLIKNVTLCHI